VPRPNIICLAIDRLHAGYLGAYGNTWISTPVLDRLASESLLLDRMMIDSPQLELSYRSLWSGLHAMVSPSHVAHAERLPKLFEANGWQTILVSDDSAVGDHPIAQEFGERVILANRTQSQAREQTVASDVAETDAALFITSVLESIERPPANPFFLWAHTGSLGRFWDAPLEFRSQYHDEDDPPAGDWATVPNYSLGGNVDPDELLGVRHAYAGQVSLIDSLVGSLIEAIDQSPALAETALLLFSPRGFPLGEHGRVGPCDEALFAELVHVPCFLRLPQSVAASQRSQALIQPADLFSTLVEVAGSPTSSATTHAARFGQSLMPLVRGEPASTFDRACAISANNERRLETPAWAMRVPAIADRASESQSAGTETFPPQLFVKPDDWCEMNDVSDRCPEIVEVMQAMLAEFGRSSESGRPFCNGTLPRELILGLE
jgi:arylsulfatase A-like enzyme